MNTTIKTSSKKQLDQIRRFVKRNNIYNTITEENDLYIIKLFGLKASEIEKFIKDFIKTNNLTKVKQQESEALAA
jgi:ABC-type Na+ transport system ATPase subunit NatA